MIRETCVAGLFYQDDKESLRNDIKNLFNETENKDLMKKEFSNNRNIVAGVVPHAGYVYSGRTACHTFEKIATDGIPETIIILGPNHTGYGDNLAASKCDKWDSPLGVVEVDTEFLNELVETDENMTYDDMAHLREHSIEVEIPFLQYIASKRNTSFKIVPIVISYQQPQLCVDLALSIYKVMKKLNRDCLVLASTDLTHYEDSQSAKTKDEKVLKSIEDMDINELINNINTYSITMCGYGPTITAISFAKLLNADDSIVLNYSNSGMVNNDYSSVVGYGSAIIQK